MVEFTEAPQFKIFEMVVVYDVDRQGPTSVYQSNQYLALTDL